MLHLAEGSYVRNNRHADKDFPDSENLNLRHKKTPGRFRTGAF